MIHWRSEQARAILLSKKFIPPKESRLGARIINEPEPSLPYTKSTQTTTMVDLDLLQKP